MTNTDFEDCVMANSANRELLARLPSLGLRGCYLTAGCLFQAVWNRISGRSANWGVKDYDIFYFDDSDLSWEAEDKVICIINDLVSDLGIWVEPRNQARVHLWYPERFGAGYPELKCARDGIDRYLIPCTSIGIDVESSEVYAPNGFADLAAGILRMNPLNPRPELFQAKAISFQSRWPWLTIDP